MIIATDSIKSQKKKLIPFLNAFEPSLLNIINIITSNTANGKLTYSDIELKHNTISITGTAEKREFCVKLQKAIISAGYPVTLKYSGKTADKKILFTISSED